MNDVAKRRFRSLFRFTATRFIIVSLIGESVYFLLYGLIFILSGSTSVSLLTAGGFCVALNAYNHSRITFKVRFEWQLLVGYLAIQLVGFLLAFGTGLWLEHIATNQWMIPLITYLIWALVSYLCTKALYRGTFAKLRMLPPRDNQNGVK